MDIFGNVGLALRIVREVQGVSVTELAVAARVGKSQLSKYETGVELPKLTSLARVLERLSIGPAQFFTIVETIDRLVSDPAAQEEFDARSNRDPITEALARLSACVLDVHRSAFEERLRGSRTYESLRSRNRAPD